MRDTSSIRSPDRWLTQQARTASGPLAAAVAAGVIDGLLVIAQAFLLAWIVSATLRGTAVEALLPAILGLLLVVGGRALCTWGLGAAGAEAAARVVGGVRRAVFERLLALGPARLAQEHSGALATVAVERVEALEGYFARFLPHAVIGTIVPLLIVAVVLMFDWIAGLWLLFAIPLVPAFMALVGWGAERLAQRQQRTLTRLSAYYLDRLRGLITLRLFGAAERTTDDVRRAADDYRERTLGVLRLAFLSSTIMDLIAAISVAVVAVYVGLSLLGYLTFGPAQEVTLLSGLTILLLAPEVFLPLRRMALHYHDRADAIGAVPALRQWIDVDGPTPPAPRPRAAPKVARRSHGDVLPQPKPTAIELKQVRFAYTRGGEPVLAGVNLSIAPGERVVIAGPSGSGKSTILSLLAGFLRPDEGRIEIAGEPPRDEGGVAWVGQRPWLFHGSLAENLRLADPEASTAQLHAALAKADLLAWVETLPDGLETRLGERGFGLSGGQGRRLALARALLSGAPILVLDEPTEGLDRASATRVLTAVRRLADGRRTVVAASHDPDVLAWADRVVTLRHGRLEAADHA